MDFEKKNENLEHLKVKQKGGHFFELPGRQKGPRLNSRIKESMLHIGIIIHAVINYCSFMIKCGKQKINEVSNIFCVKKKKKKNSVNFDARVPVVYIIFFFDYESVYADNFVFS